MHLLVPLVVAVGLAVILTPFIAGAWAAHHHDDIIPVSRATMDHGVPASMVGYVAPVQTTTFFDLDPLGAHSLPDTLANAGIGDGLTSELIQAGVLPPADDFPVDASWIPWGHELPPAESHHPLQLELELYTVGSSNGKEQRQQQELLREGDVVVLQDVELKELESVGAR